MLSKALFFVSLVKLSHLINFSWVVGSQMALFSAANIMVPLSGVFGGILGSSGLFILGILLRLVFFGSLTAKLLAFHIPGFFAALYWSTRHWSIRLIIPISCMILFVIHPEGYAAYAYAMYWLIPVILYFARTQHVFFEALGSTFVAHAVGSVIWMYTVPMSAATWLALIPIVAFERLLFASGMVLAYKMIYAVTALTKQKIYARGASHITLQ